jgi:V/A-type H+-transporting ATPase subunit I
MFRSLPARWFELLTAQEDLTLTVETLANTRTVEIEAHSETATRTTIPDLQGRLEDYHRLAHRYHQYWPHEQLQPTTVPGLPVAVMDKSLQRLHAWRDEADPVIRKLETLRGERTELNLLDEMLANAGERVSGFALMAKAGPALAAAIYVLPPNTHAAQIPARVISRSVTTPLHEFFLGLGPPHEVHALEEELTAVKGRHLSLPSWLQGGLVENRRQVTDRLADIEHASQQLLGDIERLVERHEVCRALSDITRLEWLVTNVSDLPVTENLAWVTGWTSDLSSKVLGNALQGAGVRALLRFPSPPIGKDPPLVLRNPWWAQPFELFARLIGTPGRDEADPSRMLALIAPLLFGYMFSDVGQGLVLFITGLALQRRWPFLRLLIAGGLASMVFGVVFGSVFSREDIIAPLWLHPLEHPLPVLIIPLFGGVVILLLGLLLSAVEAYWRGDVRSWGRVEAAVLMLYVGLIVSFLHLTTGLTLVTAGLLWYLAGSAWESRTGGAPFLTALGHLFESVMQLAINTLSFARVGAFALGHAGLSLAIVTIAEVTGHPVAGLMVMVLGNLLVLILEGLVVSVQTTRLVLFEFFIRFLRGEGRVFRPLAPPSAPQR